VDVVHPHVAYSLSHFYWSPMKNKGCLLVRHPILNPKSGEKFVSPKNSSNFELLGGLVGRGYKKLSTFSAKGTSIRESTSFEPFCVKIGWGV